MVINIKIGQSAAKFPFLEKGSETKQGTLRKK